MGKKAVKMSLTEFTGGNTGSQLPTASTGKDFAKSKGKGLRDDQGSRAEEGDWGRGGGKGGGGGGFRGRDRDEGESRADTGDWSARDRPERGGDRDRGDRDGGDRGGRGGFGGDRDGPRRQSTRNSDDTHADKDGDWRGGGNRDNDRGGGDRDRGGGDRDRGDRDGGDRRRSGFGDRDRGGGFGRDRRDRDDDGFESLRNRGGRDDRDDEPRRDERPRLNLKPRSKPVAGEDTPVNNDKEDDDRPRGAKSNPFGGARARDAEEAKESAPWKNKKEKGDGDEDEAPFETVGKERKVAAAPSTGGASKYVPPHERNKKTEERPAERDQKEPREREERRKPDNKDDEGFSSTAGKSSGAYVNPAKKREMERQAAEEEKTRKKKEAEEDEKARKEAEALARKKERQTAQQEAKDQEAREKKEARDRQRFKPGSSQKEEPVDPDRIEKFGSRCRGVVKDGEAAKKLAKDAADILTDTEFRSVKPAGELCWHLFEHCRRKTDEQVKEAVQNCEAIFTCLTENAMKEGVHRYKVKMLCEAQRVCHTMGLPRLSPQSSLLEVFFDGLYQSEIVEEGYFDLWAQSDDETPGKINAMFQVNEFLEWLRVARVEGDESSEGSDVPANDDDENSDSDQSDIDKGPAGYSSRR